MFVKWLSAIFHEFINLYHIIKSYCSFAFLSFLELEKNKEKVTSVRSIVRYDTNKCHDLKFHTSSFVTIENIERFCTETSSIPLKKFSIFILPPADIKLC